MYRHSGNSPGYDTMMLNSSVDTDGDLLTLDFAVIIIHGRTWNKA